MSVTDVMSRIAQIETLLAPPPVATTTPAATTPAASGAQAQLGTFSSMPSSFASLLSGATGHLEAAAPWLQQLAAVMREREDVHFVSVGQLFANVFAEEFGARRAFSVPFTALDVYPSAMANYDIALAPAGESNFYRAKSDLRWLEASALGQATIAHPGVYPEIEHGVTGFHAATPAELRECLELLASDPELRRRVGAAAKAHVTEHRNVQVASRQWVEVLQSVVPVSEAA
jgi:glycosyltransferase involved in cell wall biosynthesis